MTTAANFHDHPWRLSYGTAARRPDGRPVGILHDFYIPALERAVRYDRVAGYFRSSSLAAASQGFSAFARHGGKTRFVVGADLEPEDAPPILIRSLVDHVWRQANEMRQSGLSTDEFMRRLNRRVEELLRE